MLAVTGHASTLDQGAAVQWQAIAGLYVLDSNGKPPVLVAAYRPNEKMAIWVCPDKGLAEPRQATKDVAWDVAGPKQAVVLLSAATAGVRLAKDALQNGPRTLVALVDCRGYGNVIASLPGDPVAVAWIASRKAAVVAVEPQSKRPGATVPAQATDPASANRARRRQPADFYFVQPGHEPKKFGWSRLGVMQIADAGDGRHVFTLERLRTRTDGPFGPSTENVDGLAVRDYTTGARRALAMPVFGGWLVAHNGYAYVTTPPPSKNVDATGKETYRVEDPHNGVKRFGVDGSASLFVPVQPPEDVWGLSGGAHGLQAIIYTEAGNRERAHVRPRLVAIDWHGHGTVIGKFTEGLSFAGMAMNSSVWLASGDNVPGADALAAVNRVPPLEPRVYVVQRGQLAAKRLNEPDDFPQQVVSGRPIPRPASSGARMELSVEGVGPVEAQLIGRISIKQIRPWMICAMRSRSQFDSGENSWPVFGSMGGAGGTTYVLAYPMQVGKRMYVYVSGKVLGPLPEGTSTAPSGAGVGVATIPSWGENEQQPTTVLAFKLVGKLPLPRGE